jgi:leader peptidase (prepilin peptidase)/N-methyltransferase
MLVEHLATFLLIALLLAISIVDLRTMRIPNALNATLAVAGLAITYCIGNDLIAALLGIALGYGALATANFAYRYARGRDGIGMGDAKLLGAAGAWIGWSGLPFVVLIASATGLIFVALLRIMGRRFSASHALAFGPWLCAGIFIVWLVMTYTGVARL